MGPMYAVAVAADIVGCVPLLNLPADLIAAVALYMMADSSGVNIFDDSNIMGTIVVVVVEATPVLSTLPTWTMRVAMAKKVDPTTGEETSSFGGL